MCVNYFSPFSHTFGQTIVRGPLRWLSIRIGLKLSEHLSKQVSHTRVFLQVTIARSNCKQYGQTIAPDLNLTLEGLLLSLSSFAYPICCLFYFLQLLVLYENKWNIWWFFILPNAIKYFSNHFLDSQTNNKN
jgi:hypothetical protein